MNLLRFPVVQARSMIHQKLYSKQEPIHPLTREPCEHVDGEKGDIHNKKAGKAKKGNRSLSGNDNVFEYDRTDKFLTR